MSRKLTRHKHVEPNQPSIGIFSCSSSLGAHFPARVERARMRFQAQGCAVNYGSLAWSGRESYTTGSPRERAAEFNHLVKNYPILIGMIGGWNSSSILPFIDYTQIRQLRPKILGLSDLSAVLLAVYAQTGIPTYYGQSFLKSYDERAEIWSFNWQAFHDVVLSPHYPHLLPTPERWTDAHVDWDHPQAVYAKPMFANDVRCHRPAVVRGRLIGGNLNTIVPLLGTPYFPTFHHGDVLFIEDSEKTIAECERSFAALKYHRILEKASAIVVGKIEDFDALGTKISYVDLLEEFVDRPIPVLFNYDCGHTLPTNILKIGGDVEVDGFRGTITLLN